MIRFFRPTQAFCKWLAEYAGRRIVFDVGCGDGELVRQLMKLRVKVLGIDPIYPAFAPLVPADLYNRLIPARAEECRTLLEARRALAIFCRPCHSGFVAETIEMLHPSVEVLYCSLAENVKVDLASFKVKLLRGIRGRSECVYRILREVAKCR